MTVVRSGVLLALLATSIPFSWASEGTDVLKTTAVTRYELGLVRLQMAANKWVESYREYPDLTVELSIGESGAIDFTIAGTYKLRQTRSADTVEKACRGIARHFMKTLFSNYGDPSETDEAGINLYRASWGGYFSMPDTPEDEIETTGEAVSRDSKVRVRTGNTLYGECTLMTDESYSK